MATPASDVSGFFDRLVLISNSVPKSGSTYLFAMQRNFLLSLCGRSEPNYAPLSAAGVKSDDGYIFEPHDPEFLDFLGDANRSGGPFIVKTHAMLNANLRKAILASNTVFASTSVRDPVEVYFSARDNFRRSGEFPEFATRESGCEIVSGFFAGIYQSSVNFPSERSVPIVRYEQIVSDPISALLASLNGTIKDHILRRFAEGCINLEAAATHASERKSLGTLERQSANRKEADFDVVAEALAKTRQMFGYDQAK